VKLKSGPVRLIAQVTGWHGWVIAAPAAAKIALGANVLIVDTCCSWSVLFGVAIAKEED
jgi:hypothetical protein